MNAVRERIIYSHIPGRDGFRYFYLSYLDGRSGVMLKYRRSGGEPEIVHLSVRAAAEFLLQKRREPSEDWPFEVVDRAYRIFSEQVRRWQQRGE